MQEITIDCTPMDSRQAFHSIFAEALSFPEWYGSNLDAFHDQLTSLCTPTHIHLLHWSAAEACLDRYALNAKRAILDAVEKNPNLTVTVSE